MQTLTSRFPLPDPEFTFAGFTWPRYVAMLPRGSVADRLARHRQPVTGPYYHAPRPLDGGDDPFNFYLGSDFCPGLRWQWADEIRGAGIDHQGWYTDPDGIGDTLRGIVARLPHGRGFLAGWAMGEGMAATLSRKIHADQIAAARRADTLAQMIAEVEQDNFESKPVYQDPDPEQLKTASVCPCCHAGSSFVYWTDSETDGADCLGEYTETAACKKCSATWEVVSRIVFDRIEITDRGSA